MAGSLEAPRGPDPGGWGPGPCSLNWIQAVAQNSGLKDRKSVV